MILDQSILSYLSAYPFSSFPATFLSRVLNSYYYRCLHQLLYSIQIFSKFRGCWERINLRKTLMDLFFNYLLYLLHLEYLQNPLNGDPICTDWSQVPEIPLQNRSLMNQIDINCYQILQGRNCSIPFYSVNRWMGSRSLCPNRLQMVENIHNTSLY